MADLDITTALTQIEVALRDRIRFAYGVRPVVANFTALRAVSSQSVNINSLRYVTSAGKAFAWYRFSTAADDGSTTIRPSDVASDKPGRWIATTSTASTGYLKAVELYEGESDAAAIIGRLNGIKPAVVIVFDGGDHQVRSQIPGALYDYRPSFRLWCVSSNLRPAHETAVGSAVASEAAADPGTNRIIGDLKKLLAGSSLSMVGVRWVEIGPEERAFTSLADRLMVYSLRITVLASLDNPNNSADDVAITSMWAQKGVVVLNGETDLVADADPFNSARLPAINTVADGAVLVPMGSGLTKTITGGKVNVDGTVVTYTAASHTFAANSATYRDMAADGTLTFVAVGVGSTEPAVTTGALRIGCTVTDSSSVLADYYMAPTVNVYGDPDQYPTA